MISAVESQLRSKEFNRNALDSIERQIMYSVQSGYTKMSINYQLVGGGLSSEVVWFLKDLGYSIIEEVEHFYISW